MTTRADIDDITARFEALTAVVPLRPIRTAQDYDEAVLILNQLLDSGAADERSATAGLANLLGCLIGDYEDGQKPPRSDFSRLRFTNDQLPHMEIRALASIGAGLLERHRGDAKAVRKLARLATTFDNYRSNETAKALSMLCEEAAGPGYDDTDEVLAELARRHALRGNRP